MCETMTSIICFALYSVTWGMFTFSEKPWRYHCCFFRSSLSVFCWIASSYCHLIFFTISIFKCFIRILLNSAIFSFLCVCALNSRFDGKQILSNTNYVHKLYEKYQSSMGGMYTVHTQHSNIHRNTRRKPKKKTGRMKLFFDCIQYSVCVVVVWPFCMSRHEFVCVG